MMPGRRSLPSCTGSEPPSGTAAAGCTFISPDPEPERADSVEHQEDLLDEALEESFPASDPPAPYRAR
jgi:hypothetical protein